MSKFGFSINLLTVTFIGLKITNVINWSWWIVLSPAIFTVGILGLTILIGFITMVAFATCEILKEDKDG